MYSMCSPSMEKQKPRSRPSIEVSENPPTYPVSTKVHKEVRLVGAARDQRRRSDASDYQANTETQKKWDYHYEYRRSSDSEGYDECYGSPGRGYRNYGLNSDPEDCDDRRQDGNGEPGRPGNPEVEVASPKLTKFSQLRKLQRRATVSPVLEHYHQEDPSGEHLPMRTFAVDQTNNEEGGPSTSQTNKYSRITGTTTNDTNGIEGEADLTGKEQEKGANVTQKFRDIAIEATNLLDEITRKRKRRPWWENLLMYLRCLWLGGTGRPRRTSKLLFWHIDPRGGEHITTIPRLNGEYIVTINEVKPEPKPHNTIKAFFASMQDVALDRDPNLIRLNSPPERHNAPCNKKTPPSERKRNLHKKNQSYPSFQSH